MIISTTRRALVMGGAAAVLARPSFAQPFPSRPIRMLVGFAAGGGADTIARLYALKMQQVLNQTVIVDNRPGASQLLAIRPVMAAPADGYTVALATGSGLAHGPGVRKDLPYDPLKDFSLISMVATAPGVFFANPALPIKSMRDLINYARANPGKLNYGSAGVGAANHLQMEYVKHVTKVGMEHIPYKSDQEVTREVAAGSVHVGLTIAQFAIPLVAAGKLTGLAVTGSSRLPSLPNVPSVAETGIAELKDIDNYTFYGLIGPAGMPAPVVERLNDAINKVSAMPDVVSRMRDQLFYDPSSGTPASFRQYLEAELPKWREVGKSVKLEGAS